MDNIERNERLFQCMKDTFQILIEQALEFRSRYDSSIDASESQSLLCQLDSYYFVLSFISNQLDIFDISPTDVNLNNSNELDKLLRGNI